jgi:multidrug resistance efflux pump
LAVGTVFAGCNGGDPGTLSVTGEIEGDIVRAGSKVGGRVAEVLVNEGDRVETGTVLVRLEAAEATATFQAAQAQLDQAEAQLAKIRAGARAEEVRRAEAAVEQARQQYEMAVSGARAQEIEAARANLRGAAAARTQARADMERIQTLREGGAVSQQLLDQTKAALEAAEARYSAAAEQLALLEEGTRSEQVNAAKAALDQAQAFLDEIRKGARPEDIATVVAQRDAAAAAVAKAQVAIDEMTIHAPLSGVVDSISVNPGDLVGPGPVVSLLDPDDLELVVYVGAMYLGSLQVGSPVAVTTDAHGDERFAGTLTFISNEGEFTPRNLQTEEERARQVFAVKVTLDSAEGKLRPGMAATAHFDVRGSL